MKNLNVNLKYYNLDEEKLVEVAKSYFPTEVIEEPEIHIYDNAEYKNELMKKYPEEIEVINDMRWIGSAFTNDKGMQIFIDVLYLTTIDDIDKVLVKEYGYTQDEADGLVDDNKCDDIALMDMMIHELRHIEMYMTEGVDSPNNEEDIVKEFGVSRVKDYLSSNPIPELLSVKSSIRELLDAHNARSKEEFGIDINAREYSGDEGVLIGIIE